MNQNQIVVTANDFSRHFTSFAILNRRPYWFIFQKKASKRHISLAVSARELKLGPKLCFGKFDKMSESCPTRKLEFRCYIDLK